MGAVTSRYISNSTGTVTTRNISSSTGSATTRYMGAVTSRYISNSTGTVTTRNISSSTGAATTRYMGAVTSRYISNSTGYTVTSRYISNSTRYTVTPSTGGTSYATGGSSASGGSTGSATGYTVTPSSLAHSVTDAQRQGTQDFFSTTKEDVKNQVNETIGTIKDGTFFNVAGQQFSSGMNNIVSGAIVPDNGNTNVTGGTNYNAQNPIGGSTMYSTGASGAGSSSAAGNYTITPSSLAHSITDAQRQGTQDFFNTTKEDVKNQINETIGTIKDGTFFDVAGQQFSSGIKRIVDGSIVQVGGNTDITGGINNGVQTPIQSTPSTQQTTVTYGPTIYHPADQMSFSEQQSRIATAPYYYQNQLNRQSQTGSSGYNSMISTSTGSINPSTNISNTSTNNSSPLRFVTLTSAGNYSSNNSGSLSSNINGVAMANLRNTGGQGSISKK